jgi:hypothetical protein
MEVVSWYGRLNENHEVIFSQEWWDNVRFYHFGSELSEALTGKKELTRELR